MSNTNLETSMTERDYFWPGLSAISLAALFPLYWIIMITPSQSNMGEAFYENITNLNPSDLLYLITGLLSIYIYISLKRILVEHLNFHSLDILLSIMIGANILYVSLLGFDIAFFLAGDQFNLSIHRNALNFSSLVNIGFMIVFGILDILIGAIILYRGSSFPTLLKIFAAITLFQGFFEITVFLSIAVIFIYPIALLVLAAYFLKTPDVIEVV